MLRWVEVTVLVVLAAGWLLASAPAFAEGSDWAQAHLADTDPPADDPAAEPDTSADEDEFDLDELDLDDLDLDDMELDEETAAALEEGADGEIDLGEASVEGEAVDVTVAATPEVASVITADEIAQSGVESIADLLAREAGFTVNDTFAGAEVTFQGLPAKFTAVLIDGQRVPGRIFERVDFSQLPLANLERVEIIRGPQAAAYGSDNAGVVVNLITKDAAGLGGALALGLGTLGWNREYAQVHGSDGCDSWYLSAERKARENYDLNNLFPDTDGDSYDQYDFLGKYSRKFGRDLFHLQVNWFKDEGLGNSFSPPDQVRNNETLTRRFQSTLGYDWQLSGSENLSLNYNYGTYFHDFYRYWVGYEDTTAIDSKFKDTLHDTHATYTKAGSDYILTAGAEYNYDSLRSDRVSGDGEETSTITAGFATYEWFYNDRWTFSGALRYDDHDSFGGKWGPKATATYKIDERSDLAGAVGHGVRYPSLREQYYEFASPFGYTVLGNPDLTPETTWSYALDYSYGTRLGHVRLGAFRHEVSDLIVFSQIQDYPQVFQTQNVADATTTGFQFSAERRWDVSAKPCEPKLVWIHEEKRWGEPAERPLAEQRYIGAGLDTTWIADSEDAELGTELPNSPEWDHRLRLFYQQQGLDSEILVRNTNHRFLDRENTARAPGYTTVDLTVRYGLGPGTLKLAGLNLFDERDGKYGPEPGRELRAEYTLEF